MTMTTVSATLCKSERQHRRTIIGKLFESGSRSMSAFPLRVVYMPIKKEEETPCVSMLVSVPKRHFKRAVKRNRVKRQVREAYRLNKHVLIDMLADKPYGMVVAFIWLDKEMRSTEEVIRKVKILLSRIAEKESQV